jgi:hypothetical protein
MKLGYVTFRTLTYDVGEGYLLTGIAVVMEVLRKRIDKMMEIILGLIHGLWSL